MVYNLTAIATNSTTIVGFTKATSDVLLAGYMGTMILVGLTLLILTSYIYVTEDSARSLAATGFVMFVFALLLRALSLISNLTMFTTLALCAGAIAVAKKA